MWHLRHEDFPNEYLIKNQPVRQGSDNYAIEEKLSKLGLGMVRMFDGRYAWNVVVFSARKVEGFEIPTGKNTYKEDGYLLVVASPAKNNIPETNVYPPVVAYILLGESLSVVNNDGEKVLIPKFEGSMLVAPSWQAQSYEEIVRIINEGSLKNGRTKVGLILGVPWNVDFIKDGFRKAGSDCSLEELVNLDLDWLCIASIEKNEAGIEPDKLFEIWSNTCEPVIIGGNGNPLEQVETITFNP